MQEPATVAAGTSDGSARVLLPGVLAVSIAAAGAAAGLTIAGFRVAAGAAAAAGAVALAWGTVLATIGSGRSRLAPSRREHSGGERGLLAARLADRVFDGSVLGALAWAERGEDPPVAALAVVALGTSYMASYQRARGVSLGYRGGEGLGYLVARAALLVLALLTPWTQPLLWVFLLLTAAASATRAWNVAVQERRGGPHSGARTGTASGGRASGSPS